MRWVSGLVALAGLWIAASPLVYASTPAAAWNNGLVGLAVVVLALASVRSPRDPAGSTVAAVVLLALLGVWAVASPLVVPFENPSLAWSTAGAGGLVALVSAYLAHAVRAARSGRAAVGP